MRKGARPGGADGRGMDRQRGFKDFIIDQLNGLPGVSERAMFGGWGLYLCGEFFGIVFKGRVYFKTDGNTRRLYIGAGQRPFETTSGRVLKNYYEVPPDVIDDPRRFVQWAKRAAGAGVGGG